MNPRVLAGLGLLGCFTVSFHADSPVWLALICAVVSLRLIPIALPLEEDQ